jgi:flavin-dependent dehydrogenase
MERYDVVVIGAGLAGLESARGLAERGASVLLVDRRRVVDERVATTGIFVRRTLEDFDLPEECLGPAVRDVILASPAGRELHLTSEHVEYRVGRMGPLYRRWLDAAVAAGAEWAPNTAFMGADQAPGGGLAIALQSAETSRDVEARFLVGADGSQSSVARALGLDINLREIVGAETVHRGVPLDGPAHFRCILDPQIAPGYLAWVVHDGEEVHVGVGGQVRRYAVAPALRTFTQRMQSHYDLTSGEIVERRGGRIPVGGVLPRIANSGGLLVGDAAGAVSPLTAGGLDPCLRLSRFAVDVTLAYLASGDPAAVARYDGRWFRRHFRRRLALRNALVALWTPAALEAGCALLRTPPGRRVARDVFFGRGSFPDAPE